MISKKILFSFMLGLAMVQTTSILCTNIFRAIREGNIDNVKTALNENPDSIHQRIISFSSEKFNGFEPIDYAAAYTQDPAILEILLTNGANINTPDLIRLQTPLHIASKHNKNPRIIQWLIDHGANVNAQDGAGETPLHYANYGRSSDARNSRNDAIKTTAEILIRAGADPNFKSQLYRSVPFPQPRDRTIINEILTKIEEEKEAEALALASLINEGRRNTLLAATGGQQLDLTKFFDQPTPKS